VAATFIPCLRHGWLQARGLGAQVAALGAEIARQVRLLARAPPSQMLSENSRMGAPPRLAAGPRQRSQVGAP